jgi:hypothetical protein
MSTETTVEPFSLDECCDDCIENLVQLYYEEQPQVDTQLTQPTPAVPLFRKKLTEILRVLKQTDFNVAVGIAAHANQKLRDKLGNIVAEIWTRNSSDAETATGQLTSHEDIQTYMRDMLKEHVDSNKTLLLKADNDTLCTWILNFVTSWEQQYKETPNKFDISENILSVMRETVQLVTPHMLDTDFDVQKLEKIYGGAIKENRHILPLLARDNAVVRVYFRHPAVARYMVLIAGKLLQKRECNRNGSYCSTKQRQDVARELDRVVLDFKFKMRSADVRLADGPEETTAVQWLLYALDHKALARYFGEPPMVVEVPN